MEGWNYFAFGGLCPICSDFTGHEGLCWSCLRDVQRILWTDDSPSVFGDEWERWLLEVLRRQDDRESEPTWGVDV